MMMIPVVIGALGMIPKGLVMELEELEIRGQDPPEYWEESWRLGEIYSHSHFRERPIADVGIKNSS